MARSARHRQWLVAAAVTMAAALAGGVAWRYRRTFPAAGSAEERSEPERRDKAPYRTLGAMTAAFAVTACLWFGWEAYSTSQENEDVARAITGGNPARAEPALTRYGCAGCHTIPGIPGADGEVAPPLGGLRKRVYTGGVLPNTPDNLVAWIQNPQRFSPNSAMPETGIGPQEARDVAAYLYAH